MHPFGTAMVCGAALGVARLRGLDVGQATRAVRLAAALVPASTQRAANQGATVRNAVTGSTAAAGVLAVTLAETGTTDDALALPTVFGEVLGEGYDDTWLDEGLGSERYLRTGYLKTHACSRWNHAPIEATETLLAQHGFGPQDVVDVEVATYDPATRLDGREPHTGFAGKHSIPYNVAARILLRDNGIDAYTDDRVRDPAVRSLMQRVRVVEDPAMTAAAPAVRAARVTIRLADDRVLEATEERPPGGADRPYPPDVIRAKHVALLRRALPDAGAEALLRWCDDLPRRSDSRELEPSRRRGAMTSRAGARRRPPRARRRGGRDQLARRPGGGARPGRRPRRRLRRRRGARAPHGRSCGGSPRCTPRSPPSATPPSSGPRGAGPR